MADLAVTYGTIVCVGSPGVFLESTWSKVHQARGNMRLPMLAQIAGAAANIVLDPIFIFGLRPHAGTGNPRCGVGDRNRADGVAAVLFDFKPCETVKCGDFAAGNASVEGDLRAVCIQSESRQHSIWR